jgi:hypothetical protein
VALVDRRLAVAIVLLAPLLAGCTAQPSAPGSAPSQPAAQQHAGLLNSTEAANFTASTGNNTESDFAKSLDEKFHTHNYWGGATEKTLLDADIASSDLLPQASPTQLGLFAFRAGAGRGLGTTPFSLPEGNIVPPETNKLEVKVTWADSPTITGLRLAFSNASSERTTTLPPLPKGGGTYTIPCDLLSNDIPHTSVSKWQFYLVPSNDVGPGVFNGTAHVAIKAYRNDTLYLAPPHPDLWGANTTLPILNYSTPAKETDAVFPVDAFLGLPGAITGGSASDDTGFGFIPMPNGTIVPPHTGVLQMVLTWKNNSTLPNPDDVHPELRYSPASTRQFFAPSNAVRQGDHIVYTLPVDAKMWDSPYANKSQWAFIVFLSSQTAQTAQGLPLNAGQFDGWYRLDVTAQREAGP